MKVENTIFQALSGNLMTFDVPACDLDKDVRNALSKKGAEVSIKIRENINRKKRFAFSAGKGLIRLSESGGVEEENILGKIVSLPDSYTDTVLDFFKKNGFLFSLESTEFETINAEKVMSIINRIKAVVRLMSAIEEKNKDYDEIMVLISFLLFSEPAEIILNSMTNSRFLLSESGFSKALSLIQIIPPSSDTYSEEEFYSDYYKISDSIYGNFELEIQYYKGVINGYSQRRGTDSELYKSIIYVYRNREVVPEEYRSFVDVLFHYQRINGIINFDKCDFSNLEFYEHANEGKLDNKLKQAIIDIAKKIIGEEIDSKLAGVRARYNTKIMAPSWEVDSLYTGIYFSIFYIQPGTELYRKCANPTCNEWFYVSTTARRKKYCQSSCANAMAQREYRKRKNTSV